MNDWESSRELIDFFRDDPAPTYPEAMQALQFSHFDSATFNHTSTFVVDGDDRNPLWFLAQIGERESDTAALVYVTDRELPSDVRRLATWYSSDIAESEMTAYTAEVTMLHYLRLGFLPCIERVTVEELADRYAQATRRRPSVSITYSRR